MTLGFLSGSKNFCKLLWVSCKVFVVHGYAWIHGVAKSCTTTAYRWLFRDSQLSLRTLWSAVIKSPNLSARGTASPLRLLHGALRCWWSLFSEYCVRPRIVFYNITSEYNSTFVLLVFCLQFSIFSNDICPLMMQNELLRPTSLLHRSLLSYFWLLSGSTPQSFRIFPIPCPLLLSLQEFS